MSGKIEIVRNLAEAMALAILRGDMTAADAYADKYLEERGKKPMPWDGVSRISTSGSVVDGYTVYRWPEFVAFANRMGFKWDLNCRSITIHIPHDDVVTIDIDHVARDQGSTLGAIDTTTSRNERFRTAMPSTSEG